MEKLKQLVARVLEVEENEINDDTSPADIATWDSFNALMLVSELEKNFNVSFTMDEVLAVKKYSDIKDALKRHDITEGVDD